MRIIVGSDERTELTEAVLGELKKRGLEIEPVGPLAGEDLQWVDVALRVAKGVAAGEADQGLLFCWTGTGVSMTANKVPGARAALCADAETARGARAWNDANILCLSLRGTSVAVAKEIIDAWLRAQPDSSERENIEKLKEFDRVRAAPVGMPVSKDR
ncbi:MAG TPA: RpiB/LacA/LacB family sugar-phosphate isomerase [Dehalococcoidia bacterium]|nr:RpiB/LacA/LacB family sugar-phosphate isomerase [Dehalococcoidia bacterium]